MYDPDYEEPYDPREAHYDDDPENLICRHCGENMMVCDCDTNKRDAEDDSTDDDPDCPF
jgi:hypothetical protein